MRCAKPDRKRLYRWKYHDASVSMRAGFAVFTIAVAFFLVAKNYSVPFH